METYSDTGNMGKVLIYTKILRGHHVKAIEQNH